MPVPAIKKDSMYMLLRDEKVKEFNERRAHGEPIDLRNCDFRGLDLRGLNAQDIDFTGGYFRQADLRGINFQGSIMEGCSLNGAKISGAYFPAKLSALEIDLSMRHGTRMRYT